MSYDKMTGVEFYNIGVRASKDAVGEGEVERMIGEITYLRRLLTNATILISDDNLKSHDIYKEIEQYIND